MNDDIGRALARGHTIDITTVGRRTGLPRRIEMTFHNIDGRLYISGMPRQERRRSWLANLEATPSFTFHLKGAVQADLPASARVITDEDERRAILRGVAANWRRDDVEFMVRWSPLVEVTIDGYQATHTEGAQAHAA